MPGSRVEPPRRNDTPRSAPAKDPADPAPANTDQDAPSEPVEELNVKYPPVQKSTGNRIPVFDTLKKMGFEIQAIPCPRSDKSRK